MDNENFSPNYHENQNFYQTTIINHFEQARDADNEASFLESQINQLEDRCEEYRETIRKEQVKYDQTLTQVRMAQTLNPTNFISPINFPDDFEEDVNIRAAKREIKDLKLKLRQVKDQTLRYQSIIPNHILNNNRINFAQTISPQFTNQLNNYGNENYYKQHINELRNQIKSLDKRKILANRILAMPIDDL